MPEDREIRLAFCKLHVLYHAAKGPIYGSGRRLLKRVRGEVEELYRELVLGREPEHSNET